MMERDIVEEYDVVSTAAYITGRGFSIVALQFPDELLKDSFAVTVALQRKLAETGERVENVKLFVMADTTYGGCCADEVAAAHVDAQCIIHYGHACLSKTSRLPVFYVFGRAGLDVEHCARILSEFLLEKEQQLLVLFGLEYAHAMSDLDARLAEILAHPSLRRCEVFFPQVVCRHMDPANTGTTDGEVWSEVMQLGLGDTDRMSSAETAQDTAASRRVGGLRRCHELGGLKWYLPEGTEMEDMSVVWIGEEGPPLTNIMLTYNACGTIMRYDPAHKVLQTDVASTSRALKRRYYLVERAKDANIVGIVVGTLGVAGYEKAIEHLRNMICGADKKPYVLLMGKPNPAKLANFPECEVFVHVACAQTALLDSKDFLAPLITPFEAQLAFVRGSQWTGSYRLDFQDLLEGQTEPPTEEPRFSLLKGHYDGEDSCTSRPLDLGHASSSSRALVLSKSTQHALELKSTGPIKSSGQYLAVRSYQGLEVHTTGASPPTSVVVVVGRKGRAAGYQDESISSCSNKGKQQLWGHPVPLG